jgi:fibronectin type 3 domain-containing protein
MNSSNVYSHALKAVQLGIILLLTALFSIAHAEVPVVFWHSQPVKPNETVMVQGHAITTATIVDAQRLEDYSPGSPLPLVNADLTNPARISPLSFGESILNFVVPENWQNGVFAYRLVNDLAGAVHLVNAPEPWFFHGDQGNRSTPGGWISVYGNMLSIAGGTPKLSLVSNGIEVVQLLARSGGNSYEQSFDLPENLPEGSYQIYVHNGYGGSAAWTRLSANETVGSDLLKIVSKSTLWETIARAQTEVLIDPASNNGGALSWDAVFQVAIQTIQARSGLGGVIHVKPGVYTLNDYLVLPDHTILEGDFGQRDTTILQWGDSAVPDLAGRNPLVSGKTLIVWPATRGTFSIGDLTLARTSVNRVGVCIERAYTNTAEQSAWFRRISCGEPNTADAALTVASTEFGNYRPGFFMTSTRNTEITDSTIDMIAGITLHGQVSDNKLMNPLDSRFVYETNEFVRIENNTFRWRLAPLSVNFGLKNLVYAGNTEMMLGTETQNGTGAWADVGDFMGTFGHNHRDVYFAKNQILREEADAPYAHQGPTLDGNAGVYFGKVNSVSGTTINLAGVTSIAQPNLRPRTQFGAMVQILSGKGAGQWRHLVSNVLDSSKLPVSVIQIDRPWDVDPDASSWLSINDFQGRMIFYGNNLDNAPKLQIYYASHDVIVAENLLSTKKDVVIPVWVGYRELGWGSMTHGWHYQVLDNIGSGNVKIMMPTLITSLDVTTPLGAGAPQAVHLVPKWGSYPGYDGSYVSTHIYRGNRNNFSPTFEIWPNSQNTGFLVENNVGLSSLVFQDIPFKQEIGQIRNNISPEGNRTQLIGSTNGQGYTTDPGAGVVLNYTSGAVVNLARSGLATASNDCCWYGRVTPVDGRTGGLWASGDVGSSGNAAQPWYQIDLRTSNIIQSVKIWPRLDVGAETADVWVLVSPTPFTSNDLDTERARPEVFSQFLGGKFSDARAIDLTTVQGGKFIGRYVRAWKSFLPSTGQLQLSEIEIFGYSGIGLGLTITPDVSTLPQGGSVNYTITATNQGSNPATNVTAYGTLASCDLGTINSGASASCVRSAAANTVGTLIQSMTVYSAEPEADTTNNTATVSTNVQGVLVVSKNGAGMVASTTGEINCGAACTSAYAANTLVTLTATANANSVFAGWSGICTGTTATCSVTMDASKNVVATFNTANVIPVANAGAAQTVPEASTVTLSGSGTDTDGTIATYAWTQTAGPVVTLAGVNTATTTFIAPAAATNTLLTFQLIVTDNLGATGTSSTNVTVTHVNVQLATPTVLTATPNTTAGTPVVLSWKDNANNETAYLIEVSTGGAFSTVTSLTSAAAQTTATARTVTYNATATLGSVYTYRVTAIQVVGGATNTSLPITVVADLTAPAAPTAPSSLTATLTSATQVRLSWIDNASTETAYVVEASTNGGAYTTLTTMTRTPAQSAATGGTALTYNATVAKNNIYSYRVKAQTSRYGLTTPSAYAGSVGMSVTVPLAPTSVAASAGTTAGSTKVTWIDAASNESGFTVQRSLLTGTAWGSYTTVGSVVPGNATTGATLSVTDTGRKKGSSYRYQVRANGVVGNSAYVGPSNVVVSP